MHENFWSAMFLTTLSGLSTSIGGLLVLLYGNPSMKVLGHMLSFSSGVMLNISFVDLLPEAIEELGFFTANLYFYLGMLICGLMVYLVPDEDFGSLSKKSSDNPKYGSNKPPPKNDLLKAGVITAIGISLHNFPEGIAVYLSCLRGLGMGLPLAVAISIHNIPEGMAVAVPIYASTKSKWEAFKWCTLSGICEPAGALIAGIFLSSYLSNYMVQCSLSAVAGIMVFLCFKELIPTTLKYIQPGPAMVSQITGMFVIFISIHLLDGMTK